MQDERYAFTPPALAPLRWLAYPGHNLSPDIANKLLGEIFASPKAVIAGVLNGLVLNAVALALHSGAIFAAFMVIDLALAAARTVVVRRALHDAAQGLPTPTDLYLVTAACWCALQGSMAWAAMQSDILPLQLLAATTVMGLIGPICARNYPAPRYALALVSLCVLPFVVGAALSGNRWLLILVLQAPLLLYGVLTIIRRFQAMAIATLQAEQRSYQQARHDVLTGLLNRFGLMETLDLHYSGSPGFTLFYLDLDGFKPINDTFGHQTGDKILQAVAARLLSAVREGDIVSRLGGDEFVVVAPNMSAGRAADLASQIIRRIGQEPYRIGTLGPLRIGISIGSASMPEDGSIGDDLHRKADAALYEAKAAGKGVYRHFNASSRAVSQPCAAVALSSG